MKCPICGCEDVKIKREKIGEIQGGGSRKKKGIYSNRSAMWWICIGWFILSLDICTFGLFHLLSSSKENNGTTGLWHTVAICQGCGHTWETSRS